MAYFDIGQSPLPPRPPAPRWPRRLVATAPRRHRQGDVRQRRPARRSTHRASSRPGTRRRRRRVRLGRQGNTTGIPGWPSRPATSGSARLFLADRPDEFTHVPFNDLDAIGASAGAPATSRRVIMETIPATLRVSPLARAGLPGEPSRTSASAMAASTSPTRWQDRADAHPVNLWGITKHGRRSRPAGPPARALLRRPCTRSRRSSPPSGPARLDGGRRLRPHVNPSAVPRVGCVAALRCP